LDAALSEQAAVESMTLHQFIAGSEQDSGARGGAIARRYRDRKLARSRL